MKYVALLRGINVGGNGLIKMPALKSCFEKIKLDNVRTYIQSGNVLFESAERDTKKLAKRIETVLKKEFSVESRTLVLSHAQLRIVVRSAPKGFGSKPTTVYRYDAIFTIPPTTAKEAMKSIALKEGVDEVTLGKGVLYFSRLEKHRTQSKLPKLVSMPVYKSLTIRNWNTTTKLLALTDAK